MVTMSLCMIVKNEERVLARCLDSLRDLFEEIIIVDTGSSDATKEIARSYTDKVYDFVWQDDFALARNFSFSKATMDYIYCADADEVLDEENRIRFLNLKKVLLPEIEIVQMWYLNSKEYNTTENYSKEYRPKLYKRLRTFHWIDPIHESVNLNPVIYDSDIEILHLPESNHGKRDFGIFQKAFSKGQYLSKKLYHMYARELMLAGQKEDFDEAVAFFAAGLSDDRRTLEEHQEAYCVLAKQARLSRNAVEFFKWTTKNLCTQPCAEICCELGYFYLEQNDVQEAMVWFTNARTETQAILDARAAKKIPSVMLAECFEIMAKENEFLCDYYMEQANEMRKLAEEGNEESVN